MSMKEDLVDVIKALVLPELMELKQGQAEMKAELKVANSRHDLRHKRHDDLRDQMNLRFEQVDGRFNDMNQRFNQMEWRIQEVHENVREVRSYVWTGGYEKAKAEREAAVVRESSATYGSKDQPDG